MEPSELNSFADLEGFVSSSAERAQLNEFQTLVIERVDTSPAAEESEPFDWWSDTTEALFPTFVGRVRSCDCGYAESKLFAMFPYLCLFV